MLASFFQQMHMNAPKSMNQYMIVAKLFSGILRKCDVARHPLVIPVSLDCSKQLCPSENDNKEMFKTGCRGVMERDQSCYSVRINQRSQQTVNTHTHNISQSLSCTGTWSVFTYLLLPVFAFALNNSLPSSQRYIVGFSLLSSPPSSACNNIQLPHMNVLTSEFSSSTCEQHRYAQAESS